MNISPEALRKELDPTEDEIAEFIKTAFQVLTGRDKFQMMDFILDSKFRISLVDDGQEGKGPIQQAVDKVGWAMKHQDKDQPSAPVVIGVLAALRDSIAALPLANGEGEKVGAMYFLCSRDIKVGDRVYNTYVNEWHTVQEGWNLEALSESSQDFKIIGEIPASAVKDDILQTAITELESLIAQGQRNETEKNINDGLRMAIGVLRLQMTWIKNHPSEGQPAQGSNEESPAC